MASGEQRSFRGHEPIDRRLLLHTAVGSCGDQTAPTVHTPAGLPGESHGPSAWACWVSLRAERVPAPPCQDTPDQPLSAGSVGNSGYTATQVPAGEQTGSLLPHHACGCGCLSLPTRAGPTRGGLGPCVHDHLLDSTTGSGSWPRQLVAGGLGWALGRRARRSPVASLAPCPASPVPTCAWPALCPVVLREWDEVG